MSFSDQNELLRIIEGELITPVYQPIVNLQDGTILGYEALSRGPKNSILANPEDLFKIASQYNRLWKLDYLCRKKAIKNAKPMLTNQLLFLNVDPKILYDKDFHQGTTKKLLAESNINSNHIIFEITEKTLIDDYANFRAVLNNYQSQGYAIALDDVGSGYSGLTLLTKVNPQYIKIDLELIQGVHNDKIKQAIVKSLVEISAIKSMEIIAEGIETKEDLLTLMSMGIQYGQGFYLCRPAPTLNDISTELIDLIKKNECYKKEQSSNIFLSTPIGTIAKKKRPFSSATLGKEILSHLQLDQQESDIIIVDNEYPIGLISKDTFLSHLATNYGLSIYSNRPIKLLLSSSPLHLDYNTPINEATKLSMQRPPNHIYDSIIITKKEKYFGIATIKDLLEISTKIELNRAKDANPLTDLPGNKMIDSELKYYLRNQIPFTAIYVDLDNFKIYNDVYGFDAGDTVLITTASILSQCIKRLYKNFFLGHIGGDDFIMFLPGTETTKICQHIIDVFAKESKLFYSTEHRQLGYIVAKNRSDQIGEFPLMTISLAVLIVQNNRNIDIKTLSKKAAMIKKLCKKTWENNFIMEVLQ